MTAAKVDPEPSPATLADGSAAVVSSEAAASDIAAWCGDAPSARMDALWRERTAARQLNAHGAPLRRLDADDAQGALAALAGAALAGLRATGFCSGEALAGLGAALAGAAGKSLPLIVHAVANATPRQGPTLGAGHDGYHAVAGSGVFQLFARDAQAAADLSLIARRIAEQALLPGVVAQDAHLTSGQWQPLHLPTPAQTAAFLGAPQDAIDVPTAAQRLLFGTRRRRVPAWWSVDNPASSGGMRGSEAYALGAVAQQAYQLSHVAQIADAAMVAYGDVTGRRYARIGVAGDRDADYLLIAQGAIVPTLEALSAYLRTQRRIKVSVLDLAMLRPFPGDLLGPLLAKRKAVAVLERVQQPLADDPPLLREVRAVLAKCLENGSAARGEVPYPEFAVLKRADQAPALFSVIYGLGGLEPQPGQLVAAVDNMLPAGQRRRTLLLSAAFPAAEQLSPRQEILQQTLADAYPQIGAMTEQPAAHVDWFGAECLAMRICGRSGIDPLVDGMAMAQSLFDLTGRFVRARAGSPAEAPGRFAHMDLLLAHHALTAAGFPDAVSVVVCAHPVALRRPELLDELRQGGTLLLSAPGDDPAAIWALLPASVQQAVRARDAQVLYLDAQGIARDFAPTDGHAADAAALVLQGALLALPQVAQATGLSGKALRRTLGEMLLRRHPDAPSQLIDGQVQWLLRGVESLHELAALEPVEPPATAPEVVPAVLKGQPVNSVPALDLHRLWSESGLGDGSNLPGTGMAEPFVGCSAIPAGSGMLSDMSAQRETVPEWLPERCTGCGACWTVCPDSALPAVVSTLGEVLQTAQRRITQHGHAVEHLPRAVRALEGPWRGLIALDPGQPPVVHLAAAIGDALTKSRLPDADKRQLGEEFTWLQQELQGYRAAVTEPFFAAREQAQAGSVGLLALALNPARCQGCQACVMACPEQALVATLQTDEVQAAQRRHWSFWLDLPSTDPAFIRTSPDPAGGPGLETLLLDKSAHFLVPGGARGAPGAAENVMLRLLAAAAQATLQPRVAAHLQRIDGLVEQLERHIRLNLAVDVADTESLRQAAEALRGHDFTLSELSTRLDRDRAPVDAAWLTHVTGLLGGLQRLRKQYGQGAGGIARTHLGMVQDLTDPAGWPASHPFTPFLFPWTGSMAAGAPATALGLLEGHLAHMAQDFKLIRLTELELAGQYNRAVHEPAFARFGWRDFSDEEAALCPPLIVVGDDSSLAGHGLAGLSHLLQSGLPVKVLLLDRAAYRPLLHPAAQSAFGVPQEDGAAREFVGDGVAQGARWGGLGAMMALADRTAFVLQSSLADIPRLMQGFIDGLSARRAAVFDVYCSRLEPHPPGSSLAVQQARLAVASRAHPEFRYDPGLGSAPHQCLDLTANAALDDAWQETTLRYLDDAGGAQEMTIPLTFADYAANLPGLAHQFTPLADSDQRDALVPIADYLALDADGRAEAVPFVWAVNGAGRLTRRSLAPALIRACEMRQAAWQFLRTLARRDIVPVDEAGIAAQARQEVLAQVTRSLLHLATSGNNVDARLGALAGVEPQTLEAARRESQV